MTNHTLRTSPDLDRLDFDKGDGLVAVVAQDDSDGTVLMVGYADRSALQATLDQGLLHFWSRSRQALWRKGETSGNVLRVRSLTADCDGDAVLARVDPAGPTCHTGERTCFGSLESRPGDGRGSSGATLARLDRALAARARERPAGSYTVRLLEDENLRLKKLGEESAELVAALATGHRERAVEEAADLVYHVLVALRAEGLGADALEAELERRAG